MRPSARVLPNGEAELIIEQACRVLSATGVLVESAHGRDLLLQAGCEQKEERTLIPEKLVRRSVGSAPGAVRLYDRDGEQAADLSGDSLHFDPGSAAIYILGDDGRRRKADSNDVINLIRLVDTLPNYAVQSTALVPDDVPEAISDRYRLYLSLMHGSKPVVTGTFRVGGFAPMYDMLCTVRGGEAGLARKPLAIFDCCPSPPLKWSDLTCRCLIECAARSVPVQLVSMPLAGATAPVTLRESVVQHCAENLSGLVLAQAAGEGAPVIWGGAPAAFDMRHGTTPMGAVETMMIAMAYSEVGKKLGLPTHGYLGLSDAKTPDYQAGLETGVGAVLAALSGINMVSGPGILDFILTQSLEKLLLDHEACGMALRLARGIGKRECDAISLLAELAAAGEFLSHDHTRKFWRKELSIVSPLIDRGTYGDWEAGERSTALQRAREAVKRHLSAERDNRPDPDVESELTRIIKAEESRHRSVR